MTGCCTSGIWLTRRFLTAINPSAISTMTMATVVTGFLILKLERNTAASLLLGSGRERRRRSHFHELVVPQGRVRITQQRIAFGEPALQHEFAAARVAIADGEADLLQLAVLH